MFSSSLPFEQIFKQSEEKRREKKLWNAEQIERTFFLSTNFISVYFISAHRIHTLYYIYIHLENIIKMDFLWCVCMCLYGVYSTVRATKWKRNQKERNGTKEREKKTQSIKEKERVRGTNGECDGISEERRRDEQKKTYHGGGGTLTTQRQPPNKKTKCRIGMLKHENREEQRRRWRKKYLAFKFIDLFCLFSSSFYTEHIERFVMHPPRKVLDRHAYTRTNPFIFTYIQMILYAFALLEYSVCFCVILFKRQREIFISKFRNRNTFRILHHVSERKKTLELKMGFCSDASVRDTLNHHPNSLIFFTRLEFLFFLNIFV